ncbi:MAG: isoprenylcysteine carboxylmethyltransferase family protein [Candidatus Thorarchaeota archaeon]|nr:isoprenylcysteine carboxylmethyltransferase family protein [Candidatus Thorarchaeota archaeon]
MTDEMFYRILFVTLYAFFFSIRGYYRFVKPKREKSDVVDERKPFGKAEVVMTIAILGYFASVILYLLNLAWFAWTQIPNYPEFIRWIGAVLAFTSTPFLWWIHKTLDRQYSACLQIKESHLLITAGPYAHVRHPMYTILNLFSFGVSLVTANLFTIGFVILTIIPFPFVVQKEEKMLLETFGEEYSEYMKRTGRFFPRVKG